MQCPKCEAQNTEGATICERCGIVFEKYFRYHPRPDAQPGGMVPPPPPGQRWGQRWGERWEERRERRQRGAETRWSGLRALLLPPAAKADGLAIAARIALWVLLLVWGVRLMVPGVSGNAAGESFLHLVNLPFHEAGHVFFSPFGAFLRSLGGTLGQLLMPAVCCAVLLVRTGDPFGASVALWWLGENFLDIAPYIDDARAGVLPLLGGNVGHAAPYGFHDWEFLLTETGLLPWDHALARLSFTLGVLIMAAALVWGAALLRAQYGAGSRVR